MKTNQRTTEKIREWCQEVTLLDDNDFVRTLREARFSDAQILFIIMTLERMCENCYNRGPCPCENDE